MRLESKEIEIIKQTASQVFGDVEIYLFGSRLDDAKKGGDIDLFINTKSDLETKIRYKSKLQTLLHKPVDIVVHKDSSRAIEQEALKGIKL